MIHPRQKITRSSQKAGKGFQEAVKFAGHCEERSDAAIQKANRIEPD
jgi:hypothetical protein